MKTQWEVKRKDSKTWPLWSRVKLDDGTVSPWQKMGTYPTRKAAVNVAMVLRDRGEPIAWPGGPIRMGIALVESCPISTES